MIGLEVLKRFKDAQNMIRHEYYKEYTIEGKTSGSKALIKAVLKPLNKKERVIVGLRIAGFSFESIGKNKEIHMTGKQVERMFNKARDKLYSL